MGIKFPLATIPHLLAFFFFCLFVCFIAWMAEESLNIGKIENHLPPSSHCRKLSDPVISSLKLVIYRIFERGLPFLPLQTI